MESFPGLYRPGLIEGARPSPLPSHGARFRGFTAPASLKAIRSATAEIMSLRFRGFTAPASLKGSPQDRATLPRNQGFRGFTAPASLKGSPYSVARIRAATFPGLYRPGLIEGDSAISRTVVN